jgi:selenocysteine lyase/cysteine desulfurase
MHDEDRIEAPVTVHEDRAFLRLSFQGYNTEADLDAAVASLARLLPAVAVG